MKFSDLKEGDNLFIDANIFIYNFGALSLDSKELLLRCVRNELHAYTLTSILTEVLHRLMIAEALQKGFITEKNPVKMLKEKPDIIKKLSVYSLNVQKIYDMNIKIVELTNSIIKESDKIRKSEGLLTNDSIMVASMKELEL